MPFLLSWARFYWLPVLLLSLIAATHFQVLQLRWLLLPRLPYLLLGAALSLSIFFKSSRLAFAAALLLALYAAVDLFELVTAGAQVTTLTLGLVALNIALISAVQDRSLLSGFGFLLVLVAVGQGSAVAALYHCCTGEFLGWLPAWAPTFMPSWLREGVTQQPVVLLFAAAAIIIAVRALLRPEHTTAGLLACVTLLIGTYWAGLSVATLFLAVTGAGLLLTLLALRTAYELAFCDELTGIPSRRAYARYLLTLGRQYSIAVIDIDHFKKLNDRYGHQVGDQALRMVAGKIARHGGGRAFRYGGEEFVVVLRGSDSERACQYLEQMREKIADYKLHLRSTSRAGWGAWRRRGQGGKGRWLKTTVSVGVASSDSKMKDPQEVLRAADSALYKAKRGGRNQVRVHGK